MFFKVVGVNVGVVRVGAPAGLEATNPCPKLDVGVLKRLRVPGVRSVGGSKRLPGLKLVDDDGMVGVVSI